jgi:ectoine hydroxylase-related dioxygenase (phytanoyl-CoA dioxygenase family)
VGERNIHFRRLHYNARILDVVQDLLGPNILLFHDQALFTPVRAGSSDSWNQDNVYRGWRPATLISCWLALDDADTENGAMQVVPGSHLRPLLHDQGASPDALLDTEENVDVSKAVTVPLPAGGCMFYHGQTLHCTQPNTTARQRRAFVMHYMQPDTHSNKDEPVGDRFAHPILRMSI